MDQKPDEFLAKFLARVPRDVKETFTEEQLNAVVSVYGDRTWGRHTVDIRSTGNWFNQRFYYILLIGKERRDIDRIRAEQQLRPLKITAIAIIIFILSIMVFGVISIGLFVSKTALRFDVFPGIDMLPDQEIKQFLQDLFQ